MRIIRKRRGAAASPKEGEVIARIAARSGHVAALQDRRTGLLATTAAVHAQIIGTRCRILRQNAGRGDQGRAGEAALIIGTRFRILRRNAGRGDRRRDGEALQQRRDGEALHRLRRWHV
jgi:hypothetical protein